MRKMLLLVAISIIATLSFGQGVNFVKSFDEALSKAKAENKGIFIDFYTSWWGPCKMMDRDVFPTKKVGDYFNTNFVSLKLDAEKSEGVTLAKRFKVNSYPTLVFLDSDGELMHSASGAPGVDALIELAKREANPLMVQVKEQRRLFESKKMSTDDMISYMALLNEVKLSTDEVMVQFLKELPRRDRTSKRVYDAILKFGGSSDDYAFEYLVKNQNKFRKYETTKGGLDYKIYATILMGAYNANRTAESAGASASATEYVEKFFAKWRKKSDYVKYAEDTYRLVNLKRDPKNHDKLVDGTEKLLKEYPAAISNLGNELVKSASGVRGFEKLEAYVSDLLVRYSKVEPARAGRLSESYAYLYLLNARDNEKSNEWYANAYKWNGNKMIGEYSDGNWLYVKRNLGLVPCENYGKVMPKFTLPDLNGKKVSLDDFKGKYVLIDFWASWCGPCIGELPYLKSIHEKYGDKVIVLSITVDKSDEAWKSAVKEKGMNWLNISAKDTDVSKQYGVRGIPRIMLISPEGKLLADQLRQGAIEKAIINAFEGKL